MYNLGFCIHGPLCRYKHIIRRGPPPNPETVEGAKPREFRGPGGNPAPAQNQRHQRGQAPQLQGGQRQNYLLPSTNTFHSPPKCQPIQSSPPPPPPAENQEPHRMPGQAPSQINSRFDALMGSRAPSQPASIPVQTAHQPEQMTNTASFLDTQKTRFFVLHVRSRNDLSKAFSSCQWSVNLGMKQRLNEAFSTVQNVLLVFVDSAKRELVGCARMESQIGKTSKMIARRPGAGMGNGIPLKWLSKKPLSPSESQQLLNKWNDNKPLAQTRDGQEVDPENGKTGARMFLANA